MRPITAHLYHSTGINIEGTAEQHIKENGLPQIDEEPTESPSRQIGDKYCRSLYDAFVGCTETTSLGSRLTERELANIVAITNALLQQDTRSENSKIVCRYMNQAARKYLELLSGKELSLPRKEPGMGRRHTLNAARTQRGKIKIYEMMNSMTAPEVERFQTKTKFINSEVENAPIMAKNGRQVKKITLGAGTFGTTRIARDVETDTYVAVKKSHPKIIFEPSRDRPLGIKAMGPLPSIFSTLTPQRQAHLRDLQKFVVTPVAEAQFSTTKSNAIQNKIDSLNQIRSADQLDPLIEDLKREGVDIGLATSDPRFKMVLLGLVQQEKPIRTNNFQHTRFSYSELGLTTVDKLTRYHNLARRVFEPFETNAGQEDLQLYLLLSYSMRFDKMPDSAGAGIDENSFYQFKVNQRLYDPDFKLKDPIFNLRFQNTVGMKILQAVSALNEQGFSHQDIKPENVVLCLNSDNQLEAKLIDLDLLTSTGQTGKLPKAGSLIFMPPEGKYAQANNPISYTPVKGDAFAAGMTLRAVSGFSNAELGVVSELQAMKKHDRDMEVRSLLRSPMEDLISDDSLVQTQIRVAAKMNVVPELVTIHDIADTLLKKNPGKRLSCTEALKLKFFQEPNKFLSDSEFTEQAMRIVRFGTVAPTDAIDSINCVDKMAAGCLPVLRYTDRDFARTSLANHDPNYRAFTSNAKVHEAIDKEERALKTSANLRRVGRGVTHLFGKLSLAEEESSSEKFRHYERNLYK